VSESFFVPLDIAKSHWDFKYPLIFLDNYYELQLSDDERKKVSYKIIPSHKVNIREEDFDRFGQEIICFFSEELNKYHNVNFDIVYWKKMFSGWLREFFANSYEKIELLLQLKLCYPDSNFISCVNSDDSDSVMFSKIAKEICKFEIKYDSVISENMTSYDEKDNNICLILKKTIDKIKNKIWPIKLKRLITLIKIVNRKLVNIKNARTKTVLVGPSYFTGQVYDYLEKRSKFKIGPLSDKTFFRRLNHFEKIQNDSIFRGYLRKKLLSKYKNADCFWKYVICSVITDYIPQFYVERYKQYLTASKLYLKYNKRLKYIFSVCLLDKYSFSSFFCIYAQTQGVKIGTMMHGGDYGWRKYVFNEEATIADFFYGWGSWTNDASNNDTKFIRCPTHRLSVLYDGVELSEDYLFFVGAVLPFFSSNTWEISGKQNYHDVILRCLNSRIRFFATLKTSIVKKSLLRNHPCDFGYHESDVISRAISNLNIDSYKQKFFTDNIGGPNGRNETFSNRLVRAKIIIYDDVETPFTEALYIKKPFILLLDKDHTVFREEELPFVAMMEKVGLIYYDAVECANLINSIYDDISLWWYEEERQSVVVQIRDRYTTGSDNIDEWWLNEFLMKGNNDEY